MSEDKLRSFIKEHKSEFDDQKTPARVWDRIDQDLGRGPKKNKPSTKQIWMILSTVLVMFSAGIYFGSKYFSEQKPPAVYAEIQDEEFLEMQHYYNPLLERKQQKFVNQVSNESSKDELKALNELDEGFQELQLDFVNSSSNNKEMMMHLMKENYELRIKILEMAMEKIQTKEAPSTNNNNNYERKEY